MINNSTGMRIHACMHVPSWFIMTIHTCLLKYTLIRFDGWKAFLSTAFKQSCKTACLRTSSEYSVYPLKKCAAASKISLRCASEGRLKCSRKRNGQSISTEIILSLCKVYHIKVNKVIEWNLHTPVTVTNNVHLCVPSRQQWSLGYRCKS